MMNSLTTFLLATILALASAPAPQSQKKSQPEEKTECGTVISPEQIKAELARKAESARNKSAALALAPNTNAPIYLPLTIHMVCDSFGVGGFNSPGELERTIEVLNQMWQPVGIQFFIYGQIDFSIHDDTFYYLANDDAKQDALRRINSVPNTINVYFTNLNGITGQARFTHENAQGILLDYTTMSEYYGGIWKLDVFAHEIGHYFDLYHTHEDDFGSECPSGSNCDTTGDLLCDTPADPRLNQGFVDVTNCTYNNMAATPADCAGAYNPSVRNLMSYAPGHCRNEFTPGQISKVWQVLTSNSKRKGLMDSYKFYVDPVASSSNAKCTAAAPCRTVAKAVQAAQDGAVIYLRARVHRAPYLGGKRFTVRRWGDAGIVTIKP
ncbi:MAG: M43 family zinc metalloprotease [Blastocatellia bacterium]